MPLCNPHLIHCLWTWWNRKRPLFIRVLCCGMESCLDFDCWLSASADSGPLTCLLLVLLRGIFYAHMQSKLPLRVFCSFENRLNIFIRSCIEASVKALSCLLNKKIWSQGPFTWFCWTQDVSVSTPKKRKSNGTFSTSCFFILFVLVKGLAFYHFCSTAQAVHIISSCLFSHHKQMTNYKIHSTIASDCTSPTACVTTLLPLFVSIDFSLHDTILYRSAQLWHISFF